VHLHEFGRCEAPFASAGDHWNPTAHAHGVRSPAGPHIGDVYNQVEAAVGSNARAGADGTAALRGLFRGVTLRGGVAPLLDADGNALMIHAGEDDNVTDPSGNSGGRIACGVIVAGPAALPRTGAGVAGVAGGTAGAVAGGLLGLTGLLLRRRR
jgi:Cu-Zn family superoxide dismutase